MNVFKQSEKSYWKNRLIEFIKEKNSIVQRHALSALSKFRDFLLIKEASQYLDLNDELVARSYISACTEVDPNDKFSIDCFVKWSKSEREYISARYGLWAIKEKKALKYLLDCFISDPVFLTQFMEHETIFDNKDDYVIQNIKNVWDSNVKNKLEQIVISAFSCKRWYVVEKAQFIKRITLLLNEKDKDYIFKLIAEIKKTETLKEHIFSIMPIFSLLLEESHVELFVYELKEIGEERCALWTLQSTLNNKKEVYEEGRKYFREEYVEAEKRWKSEEKKANKTNDIYRDFRLKLEPHEGMYHTGVFDFYLRHEEQLKQVIDEHDKKRMEKLITESNFDNLDPGKQKLTITKRENSGMSYTINNLIPIFGDCLRVAESLKIDISKYRQRIINYIPFAWDEDLRAIFSLVPDPTDREIKSLLHVWKKKRDDDLQRFRPENLIKVSEQYRIVEAVPVLKKFVDEPEFLMQDRTSALRAIAAIQPDEKYLKNIFKKYKGKKDVNQLAEDSNKYLIEMFSNDEAITWRIKKIKEGSFPFEKILDMDLIRDNNFASPIMNLKQPKYKEQFFAMLDKSFAMSKKGKDHYSYAQYLREIVATYFNNLRETKSYKHLRDLERYIREHSSEEGMNWFKYKLQKLRVEYMRYIGKPKSIAECIKKYNKLKEAQYLDIASSEDLSELIKKVINEDLRKWVEDEGAYKFISYAKRKQEDLIQKTIKTQFESCLQKKGLRGNEVSIRREEQLLDDKRTDFLISYGFIGPILIETKLLHRDEVIFEKARKKYKSTLLNYINGTKSDFGIFLIFRINNKYSLKDYIPKVKEVYKDCGNLVEVIDLDCIKN